MFSGFEVRRKVIGTILFLGLLTLSFQNCGGFGAFKIAIDEGNFLSATVFNTRVNSAKKTIWFSPNLQSADYHQVLTQDWNSNRAVGVFKFHSGNLAGDQQIRTRMAPNDYWGIKSADGFRKLQAQGLRLAVELGVIKGDVPGWCDGAVLGEEMVRIIDRIAADGGNVELVTMDEPMNQVAGTPGSNCGYSLERVADETAKWMRIVRAAKPNVQIIDIESYPNHTVDELKSFVNLLSARGQQLDGFHLDVNRESSDTVRGTDFSKAGEQEKLIGLANFLKERTIRFGLIYWGQRIASDEVYMADIRRFYDQTPDLRAHVSDIIFQSWHPAPDNSLRIPKNFGDPLSSHISGMFQALESDGTLARSLAVNEVRGTIDSVTVENNKAIVAGWACMAGSNTSIDVHVYVGGAGGIGTMVASGTANQPSEAGVADACEALGSKYRFRVAVDAAAGAPRAGQPIFVHGISRLNRNNLLLSNSGLVNMPTLLSSVQAPVTPADPGVSATPVPTPVPTPIPTAAPVQPTEPTPVPLDLAQIYRLFKSGEGHLFSTSNSEGTSAGWTLEGPVFRLSRTGLSGMVPLYRCFASGDHFLSQSAVCEGAVTEGVVGHVYSSHQPGTTPLSRFRHTESGLHIATTNPSELNGTKYQLEGIIGYVW